MRLRALNDIRAFCTVPPGCKKVGVSAATWQLHNSVDCTTILHDRKIRDKRDMVIYFTKIFLRL